MASLIYQLMWLTLTLVVVQMVTAYTFMNCIEDRNSNHRSFKCNLRKKTNITDIIVDLPPSVVNLTILSNPIRHIPNDTFARIRNLSHLRLDGNHLSTIDNSAFRYLHQLNSLNLSFNNISQLSHSLFSSLHKLTVLSLRGNKLKQLPVGIFSATLELNTLLLQQNHLINFSGIVESVSHLRNLLKLDLCHNNFTSLSHNQTQLPRSLIKLYLRGNNLSTLGCDHSFLTEVKSLDLSYNSRLTAWAFVGVNLTQTNDLKLQSTAVNVTTFLNISNIFPGHLNFAGMGVSNDSLLLDLCKVLRQKMSKLSMLRLGSNGIRDLQNDTLSHCPIITKSLDLSQNRLGSSQEKNINCLDFLGKNRFLKTLNIEHNHLPILSTCKKKQMVRFHELEDLSFRYNRILSVDAYAFYHTPNIKTLKLNINTIASLHRKALKGSTNLRQTFEDLSALQILNLRNNRISVIFNRTFHRLNNLTTLDLGGNKISTVHPSGLEGLKSLSKLYMDGNNLKQINMSLHGVFKRNLSVLDLENNLIRFNTINISSPFLNMSRLRELKLGSQRPYGLTVLPRKFFRGLANLFSLYLNNNQISYISTDAFDDLKKLSFLNLDKCCEVNIQLKPGVFKNLHHLTRLVVENVGIQNFSQKVFGNLTQLQALQLNHNGMQTLEVEVLNSLPNLRYLDIRHLPLSCTCVNSLLQKWTKDNTKVQVVYVYDLPCQQDEKKNFYNFDTNICYIDLGEYLFLTTATVVTFFTALPLLHIKLYWKMKYGYYVFRSWFGEQWRKLKEEEENCIYDAFVSYNSNDEEWVMVQLLPNLEGNGSSLKLCLHHRDFEPGRDIIDNIVTAVYSSRKTICVVSRNFLQSEWCSLEIQLASYRLFDEHRDVLLLVFLEPVSERQMSSYHRMRKVMLKKTYLQWPASDCVNPEQAQELFWSQLRRALKTGGKLEIEDNNETPDSDDLGESDTQTLIADGNFYTY
nr:toll like receptor 21 [Syngnathoides biaculeatus]